MLRSFLLAGLLVSALLAAPALDAGSHLWVINEVFSNADGSVQFIEMKESMGASNEIALAGKWVISLTTGNQYFFTENLPPNSTANKHILLATPAFAALPGAPTPDHIIDPNFFDLVQDTIRFWNYSNSVLVFQAGDLPLDGINSLNRDGSTGPNTPTNFNDETGTVDASGPAPDFIRGDCNADGDLNVADPICTLEVLFNGQPNSCDDANDTNDDGGVDIADAVYALTFLFSSGPAPQEPFPACGADPTDDSLVCGSFAFCP